MAPDLREVGIGSPRGLIPVCVRLGSDEVEVGSQSNGERISTFWTFVGVLALGWGCDGVAAVCQHRERVHEGISHWYSATRSH